MKPAPSRDALRLSLLPSLLPRLRRGALVLTAGLLLALPGTARAGSDDFEFGQKLAQNRWFKQAQRVFEEMLADPKGSKESQDLARYGLATLGYEQALSASGRSEVPFAEVSRMALEAADRIAEFATQNPNHPRANEAKLKSGTVRLWLVQWAQSLVETPETLAERKTTSSEVLGTARSVVEQAVSYFEGLKSQPEPIGPLAEYYWTMCQYYRALAFEPCSGPQIDGFKQAEKALDDYVTNNDGKLLASFAQDVLGQVYEGRAKCATSEAEKIQLTNKALDSFDVCIETEYTDGETLTVIVNGYYHYGQACLQAGRLGTTNYLRQGADRLGVMLERVPNAGSVDGGIRALVVLGDLRLALGNVDDAIATYTLASNRAQAIGRAALQQVANRKITEAIVKKSGSVNVDVTVLRKVADSLFADGKFAEAIGALRNVIAAAPPSTQGFMDYAWPAWDKLSRCYEGLGDPLSAALALEPVYEAWKDGRIPTKAGDPTDLNHRRAGDFRLRQIGFLDQVSSASGSAVFRDLLAKARRDFAGDFPLHSVAQLGELNTAQEKFNEARELRRTGSPSWRAAMEEARNLYEGITTNERSDKQETAWGRIAVIDLLLVRDTTGNVKAAAERALAASEKAFAAWASPEGRKQLVDFPNRVAPRKEAETTLRAFRGEYLKALGRWDEVLTEMKAFREALPTGENSVSAQALIVEAYLAKTQMTEADQALDVLIQLDKRAPQIPGLVNKIADTFDSQYSALTKRWNALNARLKGSGADRSQAIEPRLRELRQRLNADSAQLAEVRLRVDAAQRRLDAAKAGQIQIIEREKDELTKTVTTGRADVAELEKRVPDLEKQVAALVAEQTTVEAEMKQIVSDQYRPLKEAVTRYQKGLDVEKAGDVAAVQPARVRQVATRWYFAGRNPQGQPEDWTNAKREFEFYLGLPAVRALPDSDASKRDAIAKLGRIYSHEAEKEADPAQRLALVRKAVTLLESSVAPKAENTELVVGLLEGRYAVWSWQNETERDQPTYRFVLPKVESAAALKLVVEKLGTADSKVSVPVLPDAAQQAAYRKALTDWKALMAKAPAGDWESLWKDLRGGGMDAATYRWLANTDFEFRLSLASAYADTGEDADAAKCETLVGTVLRGPIQAEEYSDDWWEANTIGLRNWVNWAERLASQSGAPPAKASSLRKQSRQLIQGRTSVAMVPESQRAEWKRLIEQLNKGLRSEGAPPVEVDLDKPLVTAPPDAPAPSAPAPSAPAPGAPAPGAPAPGAPAPAAPAPAPAPAPEQPK